MTTQSPTWREQSAAGRPSGERATAGTVVGGRYELRSPVGHGGMGTVWRASDTLLRRDVAVKEVLLPPTMPKSEQDALCERTLREARAAAALSHPSVVQVYDVVTDDGRPWIVMELLEARSLADMVIDDGPLSPRAVAKVGIAMLGALEVAHAAGVLHRDVKPANVLISTDGRCVLTDFGVARMPTESKLTTPGMVLGSPHFISPERAVGGAFGPPSDLFSLGVTLYTAVEGGPPFDRGDPFETMRAVVEEEPRPARLAGPLQPVLWGLLDKDPARRWNVDHARTVLRELLSGALSRPHAPDTDPQAIVRPPAAPPPPSREPESQVGGRAMLNPNESLTDQLARLRAASAEPRPGPVPLPDRDHWAPAEPGDDWAPAQPRREGTGRRRARSGGAVMAEQVAGRVKALGREQSHRRTRVLVGAGLVAVLAVSAVLVGMFARSDGTPSEGPSATASAAPSAEATPLIAVQEYRERGIAVNVPKDWTRSASGTYVDYTDPSSKDRKVRINIENSSSTSKKFLQAAESRLKSPSGCTGYQQVGLQDVTLAGKDGAAELEYTCGAGDKMRHGIWRALVLDGKAYHFYLTVPDSRFVESKVIFDEMVRSFQFTS